MAEHLPLLIEFRNGKPVHEPVHVEALGTGRYKLLFSPGLVLGIAAGDEFVLRENGAFEVTKRSGNLAVQVFSKTGIAAMKEEGVRLMQPLGGTLDGAIDRALVFTVPFSAGWGKIEAAMNQLIAPHAGAEWFYGNVYDPKDGVTPLNWWNS